MEETAPASLIERLPVDALLEVVSHLADGYTLAAFSEGTSKLLREAILPLSTPHWKRQHCTLCSLAAEEALNAEEEAAGGEDEPVFLSRAHLLLSTRRRTARTIEHYFLPNADCPQAWKLAYTRTLALQKRTAKRLQAHREAVTRGGDEADPTQRSILPWVRSSRHHERALPSPHASGTFGLLPRVEAISPELA